MSCRSERRVNVRLSGANSICGFERTLRSFFSMSTGGNRTGQLQLPPPRLNLRHYFLFDYFPSTENASSTLFPLPPVRDAPLKPDITYKPFHSQSRWTHAIDAAAGLTHNTVYRVIRLRGSAGTPTRSCRCLHRTHASIHRACLRKRFPASRPAQRIEHARIRHACNRESDRRYICMEQPAAACRPNNLAGCRIDRGQTGFRTNYYRTISWLAYSAACTSSNNATVSAFGTKT